MMKKILILLSFIFPLWAMSQTKVEAESYANTSFGISTTTTTDIGGIKVTSIDNADYIDYTIPSTGGRVNFVFRVAGWWSDGAQFTVSAGTGELLATVNVPFMNADKEHFQDIAMDLTLPSNTTSLRFFSSHFGWDFNYFTYYKYPTPIANAGADTVISGVFENQVANAYLHGDAITDAGNTIISWNWTALDNFGSVIESPNAQTSNAYSLIQGKHRFKLTTIDNTGSIGRDTITVSVQRCKGGKRIYVIPNSFDSSNYYQTADYPTRLHRWQTYGYPDLGAVGGDTITLDTTRVWNLFQIYGYKGDSTCPIVIRGGELTGQAYLRRRIGIIDCEWIKVDGRVLWDTTSSVDWYGTRPYGIQIHGVGDGPYRDVATFVSGFCSNIDIGKIRMEHVWYFIQAKTDPFVDPWPDTAYNASLYRPSYIMRKISFHDNYLLSARQDGGYFGNTDPAGTRTYTMYGQNVTNVIPLRMADVLCYNNNWHIMGRTAMQFSGVTAGWSGVWNNAISQTGEELNQQQGFGGANGHSSNLHVFNNNINKTFLYGIFDLGVDRNYYFDNRIDSTGYINNSDSSGDFADWTHGFVNRDSLVNNSPTMYQVLNGGRTLKNIYQGAAASMIATTTVSVPHTTKTIVVRNNKFGENAGTEDPRGSLSFRNYGPEDWADSSQVCGNTRLDGVTPASVFQYTFNAAMPQAGVPYTWNGAGPIPQKPNTVKATFRSMRGREVKKGGLLGGILGATFLRPILTSTCTNRSPFANAGADINLPAPLTRVYLTGSVIDPNGYVASTSWTQVSGALGTTIVTPSKSGVIFSPDTYVTGLAAGTYVFRLTATDNEGSTVTDDVTVTVNTIVGPYIRTYTNVIRMKQKSNNLLSAPAPAQKRRRMASQTVSSRSLDTSVPKSAVKKTVKKKTKKAAIKKKK